MNRLNLTPSKPMTMHTTLIFCISLAILMPSQAEEKADEKKAPNPKGVSLIVETFTLPLTDAAGLIREDHTDAKLYQLCVDRVTAGTSKQQSITVLRSPNGGKTTNESVLETIYATAYEPPEMPNSVNLGSNEGGKVLPETAKDFEHMISPATPTAFKTRNLGITVEAATKIDDQTGLISIDIVPSWIRHVGRSTHGHGKSTAEMPEIEMQQISTSATVRSGSPFLLGTFNRTPESTVEPTAADQVWFAFVTARTVVP